MMNSRLLQMLALTSTIGLASGLPWAEGRAPKPNPVLKFKFEPAPGDTVQSDGLADSPQWQYADFRVTSQATSPICVQAEITTSSFVFVVLNRAMNAASIGNNDGPRCSTVGGLARNWVADIGDWDSCQRLSNYDPDRVVLNGDGTCRLNGADNPRIRIGNLYAPKLPATTPIALLISSFNPPSGHGGYEIRTETEASIQSTSTGRTMAYTGTARLWEFIGRAAPVANPFPFQVHMSFEKFSVPQ